MTFDEVKKAVLSLGREDQKRLITEIVPEIWPQACTDESCLKKMRELVDEETIKPYREKHLDHI